MSIRQMLSSVSSYITGIYSQPTTPRALPLIQQQKPQNLEVEFENQAFCDVDVTKNCDFRDYLIPNELSPYNILPLLQTAGPGLIVSTGTERSFFDLILADPKNCKGLVIRDINPKVKAYVDFNILLLKISQTREEYIQLSESLKNSEKESLNKRIELISKKVKEYGFSNKIENYYLKHLNAFGKIYLTQSGYWKKETRFFQHCKYDQDDRLFSLLQQYARSGNIISTIGDINELRFLKDKKIAVVDTSNIKDYIPINLQGEGDFQPLIIWVSETGMAATRYFALPYSGICTELEKQEFDKLVKILIQAGTLNEGKNFSTEMHNLIHSTISYSKESLLSLQSYVDRLIIQDAAVGPVDISCHKKLASLTTDQIQILIKHPKTKECLSSIFRNWVILNPQQYLAFCQIEGWQDEFEASFSNSPKEALAKFLGKLQAAGLLTQFTEQFGAQRLAEFEKS